MNQVFRSILICTGCILLFIPTYGQNGIGFRFATNINTFPRAADYDLVDNGFTTGIFGVFLSRYQEKHGFEFGLNIVYKDHDNKGFPNLPVVMRDFGDDEQNVGLTSLEMDLKVGPRFKALNPKIGYILGYRLQQAGFQEPGADDDINRWYLMLPFGLSFNLPTNYGSVGFGSYYNVGIFNVLKNPNPGGGGSGSLFDGGRQRYLNFEIVVSFGN